MLALIIIATASKVDGHWSNNLYLRQRAINSAIKILFQQEAMRLKSGKELLLCRSEIK